jgi:hypothetical protein
MTDELDGAEFSRRYEISVLEESINKLYDIRSRIRNICNEYPDNLVFLRLDRVILLLEDSVVARDPFGSGLPRARPGPGKKEPF